jgi:Na+-transporting NADH:ubiquinone oxidoreductase subunit NqrC
MPLLFLYELIRCNAAGSSIAKFTFYAPGESYGMGVNIEVVINMEESSV